MTQQDPITRDEILLRRIPPPVGDAKNWKLDEQRIERPCSDRMRTRKDPKTGVEEEYLSCSRLHITTPAELLQQLCRQETPLDPQGWRVCAFRVGDVLDLRNHEGTSFGLTVKHECTALDAGHVGIYGKDGQPFPRGKSVSRKLTEIARMLCDQEVSKLAVGGHIDLSHACDTQNTCRPVLD